MSVVYPALLICVYCYMYMALQPVIQSKFRTPSFTQTITTLIMSAISWKWLFRSLFLLFNKSQVPCANLHWSHNCVTTPSLFTSSSKHMFVAHIVPQAACECPLPSNPKVFAYTSLICKTIPASLFYSELFTSSSLISSSEPSFCTTSALCGFFCTTRADGLFMTLRLAFDFAFDLATARC